MNGHDKNGTDIQKKCCRARVADGDPPRKKRSSCYECVSMTIAKSTGDGDNNQIYR